MAKQRKSQNFKEQLTVLLGPENLSKNSEPELVWDGIKNPLQTLNHELFQEDERNGKKQELVKPVLEAAIEADKSCSTLYQYLNKKTETLADTTVRVQFPWLLRVSGMRGFRELLLPAMHPVYGVPYIPASSLKGVIHAWAREQKVAEQEINRLLGYLKGKEASIGRVQILDAFPTKPCLSLDIANPQWTWKGNEIKYGTVPHTLLSLHEPALVIGLVRTKLGCLEDVETIRGWLEQAINQKGLGSRVSTGYGRSGFQSDLPNQSRRYEFELWTQGMYGADTQKSEFRPTALRGMLRYWFRAFALGIYDPDVCKSLEAELFGTIEPKVKEGSIRIGVRCNASKNTEPENDLQPYKYTGKFFLESKVQKHLLLVEKILQISSHLGGIGRGARRPLHKFRDPANQDRLRGCYWEIINFELSCNIKTWEESFQHLYEAFKAVKSFPEQSLRVGNLGNPKDRNQDVFDRNTKIYLLPCLNPEMKHPEKISNWRQNGDKLDVIGKALHRLYSDDKYKGKRNVNGQEKGNPYVGGELGTPSYVVISSNFPQGQNPYQVVTIFGANHPERNEFAKALEKDGAILISLASAYGKSR